MNSRPVRRVVALFGSMLVASLGPHPDIDAIARKVVEAPSISQVELSPDGKQVLYAVTTPSVSKNHVVTELFVRSVDEAAAASAALLIDRAVDSRTFYYFNAHWCPTGSGLSYVTSPWGSLHGLKSGTFVRYDFELGRPIAVPIRDDDAQAPIASSARPRIVAVGRDYRWLRSGTEVAFTAPLESTTRVTPTTGVRVDQELMHRTLSFNTRPKQGLFVMDAATGHLEQISSNSLDVRSFAWAPDDLNVALAVVADKEPDLPWWQRLDIVVVNRRTREIRVLVTQPGEDTRPLWSPDGQWIAFQTAFGASGEAGGKIAAVPAAGGPPVRFLTSDVAELRALDGSIAWTADSRNIFYATLERMTTRVRRAALSDRRVRTEPLEEGTHVGDVSFSGDGFMAFVRSSPTTPPELCVRALPNGPHRQLTAADAGFSLATQVQSQVINWSSRDRKVTIHGLLLSPQYSATSRPRFPTLVYVSGGPSMVRAAYRVDGFHPEVLALVAHGYAVLLPNTRGRGGYGTAFERGIEDGGSFARLPYEDMMSGVDHLVQRGITDPQRLGIWGHSYGGYLASYAITRTRRFRAAINYEGGGAMFVGLTMARLPGTAADRAFVAGVGVRNPFEPRDLAQLIAESPAFNLHCAATPMMLMFGERSLAKEEGTVFYSGLKRLQIPSDFFLYDEGHVFSMPTAQIDYIKRMADWFDYWIHDVPYPDPALRQEYDRWRETSASRRSSPPCADTRD